jgi:hypothetical protein
MVFSCLKKKKLTQNLLGGLRKTMKISLRIVGLQFGTLTQELSVQNKCYLLTSRFGDCDGYVKAVCCLPNHLITAYVMFSVIN